MDRKEALERILDIKYHTLQKGETTIAAEYIWLDGENLPRTKEGEVIEDCSNLLKTLPEPRSKTKFLTLKDDTPLEGIVPSVWGFDGSSTNQATGKDSDRVLLPVAVFYDPLRNDGTEKVPHVLVLNEVFYKNGRPHPSNTRKFLREAVKEYADDEFWFGIEQEYTLMTKDNKFIGFLDLNGALPDPQGKYYCGAGADRVFGREIAEEHWRACLRAGLKIAGINAEVMPGQWEYQVGADDPLTIADHLVVARYVMNRIGEKHGVIASLNPKPHPQWNGAGAHTNFSTKGMRDGTTRFDDVIERLRENHTAQINLYGEGIEKRLIGIHETSSCDEFTWGVSDRGASGRTPWQCDLAKKGYLEDRRPCANMDPYLVLSEIMDTVGSH